MRNGAGRSMLTRSDRIRTPAFVSQQADRPTRRHRLLRPFETAAASDEEDRAFVTAPARSTLGDYVTVKHPTQRPVPLSGLITFTVLASVVVPEEIVMRTVSLPAFTKVVEFTVIPDPKRATAPGWKLDPRTSTERGVPLVPLFGEVDVGFGAGSIVRHPAHVAEPPPVVTVTSRSPTGAVAAAFTFTDSLLLLTKVVETTVTPVPDTDVVAPDWKLVPFTAMVRVPAWPSVFGLRDEIVGPPAVTVRTPFPVLV